MKLRYEEISEICKKWKVNHNSLERISCHNRIYGEYSQSMGAIYQDVIIIILYCFNTVRQDLLSHEYTGQSRFKLRETDVGGNQIHTLIVMKNDVIEHNRFLIPKWRMSCQNWKMKWSMMLSDFLVKSSHIQV